MCRFGEERKKARRCMLPLQMVMPMRLELTRVAPLPPQSSVSAIPPRHRYEQYYTISPNEFPV